MSKTLKQLKQIKEQRKLTYDQLSQRLGFPSMTIARWFKTNKINRTYEAMLIMKMKNL